jgi:RNA polymerase sigma factor (sigma-70 family)
MEHTIAHDTPSCDTTTTFNELWDRYRTKIFVRLLTLTHNREVAEDLTQETYLRAWRYLPRLAGEQNLYGWLFLIATNIERDWYRHEHGTGKQQHTAVSLEACFINDDGDSAFDIPDERYDPERVACEKELMLTALGRVNPEARDRLVSHFIENEQVERRLLYHDRRNLNDIYERVERGLIRPGPKPGKKGRAA